MSGIAGAFDRTGTGHPIETGARLASALVHRGPDRIRETTAGPAVFVHLHQIVGSRDRLEALPRVAGDLLITCDARLDNRAWLADQLRVSSHLRPNMCDSELILRAYLKWGARCASFLEGDFAFAIFDSRTRSILLARDFLGAKPLYYALDHDRLTFASEARGVIAAMSNRPALDRLRMVDYLCFMESADARRSFHEGVSRLPPATTLVVTANREEECRYWSASEIARNSVDIGHDEAVSHLATLLGDACRARTEALDSPAALSLSGGVDSALVAAFSDSVPISAVSADADCADTSASRRVRARLGPGGIEVDLGDAASRDQMLSETIAKLDDPFSSIQLMTMLLFQRAREQGHRVLLDGIEGDLVYSVPGQLIATLIRGRNWHAAWQELRAPPILPPLRMARLIARSCLPRPMLQYRADQRANQAIGNSVLAPYLKTDSEVQDRIRDWTHQQARLFIDPAELHASWIDRPFITSALERYERIAALCGVEIRHPLLAKPLVEFALRLPWHFKFRARQSKRVLRDAGLMRTALPPDILHRMDRPHLGWSFCDAWMRRHWPEIRTTVDRNRALWQPWADPARLAPVFSAPTYDSESDALESWYWYHWICWLERAHNECRDPNE